MIDSKSLLTQIMGIPLDLEGTRDLILVRYGLKPSTSLSLIPNYQNGSEGYVSYSDEFITNLERALGNFGFQCDQYKVEPFTYIQKWKEDEDGKKKLIQEVDAVRIYLGKDQESLEKLMNTIGTFEDGYARGYPDSAIKHYRSLYDPEKGDKHIWARYWKKLKEIGSGNAPEELAFISFCPSVTENGKFNKDELKLSRDYANFFGENFPKVYERIVEDFKRKIKTKEV